MNDNSWVSYLIGISIIFFLLPKHPKYQVSNNGSDRAIVLDTQTGEAWITDYYEDYRGAQAEKRFYFEPVTYMYHQKDQDGWNYTPDEIRNNKNSSWETMIDRKVFAKFKG